MTAQTGEPEPGEVCAVAELIGVRSDHVSAVKLPGPGGLGESVLTQLGELPALEGFEPGSRIDLTWGSERRFGARYDSPTGTIIVVSHETGPELFFALLGGAAAAIEVTRGIHDFVVWLRARRGEQARPEHKVPIQFWFVEGGRLRRREVFRVDQDDSS